MDQLINALLTNKILMVIAILLLAVIIYSVLKKLIKLIIIILIGLVLYLGYINYRGEKPDPMLQNYINKGVTEIEGIQKKTKVINNVIDTIEKGEDKE